MWPVSASWDAAVRASHTVELRVDAYRNGVLIASDLPVEPDTGSLTVDGASPIRRSVELTIADPSLVPTVAGALLSPHNTELVIRRGFRYANGITETVPVGVFRIARPATPLYGGVQVQAVDRAKLVQDDTFITATTSHASATYLSEIQFWLRESLGQDTPIHVRPGILTDAPLPSVAWEEDTSKLDAIGEMALAADCEVYADPEGVFVIRAIPKLSAAPVWTIDMGSTGVLVDATEEWDREEVHNAVTCRGEPADGSMPVRWTARDVNKNSPTYWYGEFGHRPKTYTSALVRTVAQAMRTAETLLWRSIAPARTVRVSCVPNPALEDGDVVMLNLPGTGPRQDFRRELHMVRGYTMPLGLGPMELDLYTPEPVL